jgi:GxxExxY protein
MNHRGTEGTEVRPVVGTTSVARTNDPLTRSIIGGAIEVHRALGPGLLESAYHRCLFRELSDRGHVVRSEVELPVTFKGERIDCAYRIDLLVDDAVIVELKCAEALKPIHEAQILTYLRLSRLSTGLLINFHVPVLHHGIKRFRL